jgi:hypothetical protein
MIAYQPETLNTLDPYCGPQGYGMQSGSMQTIDNITTVGKNQIDPLIRSGKIARPTRAFEGLSESRSIRMSSQIPSLPTLPATVQVTPVVIETTPAKAWYKSPLYLALLAGGIFFMAKKYKFI